MAVRQEDLVHFTELFSQRAAGDGTEIHFKDFIFEPTNTSPLTSLLEDAKQSNGTCYVGSVLHDDAVADISEQYRSPQVDEEMANESVIGSPLKLQRFDMNSSTVVISPSVQGHRVQPMTVNQARPLLSMYTQYCTSQAEVSQPPLWLYCDQKDMQHTAMIGAAVHRDPNADRGTVIITSKVSVEPDVRRSQLPRLETLLQKDARFGKNSRTSIHCVAQYGVQHIISTNLLDQPGFLTIGLDWNHTNGLLEMPPLDAKAVVKACVSAGDPRSSTYHLFLELQTLEGFIGGLAEGLVSWSTTDTEVSLMDRVRKLVEAVQQGDAQKPRQSTVADEDAAALKLLTVSGRKDLDFTERLWDILKDCGSFNDLVECLRFVLQQLHSGQLQPMVHKSNRSMLAELVRESYYQKMVMPNLEGTLPVQILAELGLEKLRRDYMDAFLANDLVMVSHLEPFVLVTGEPSERLSRLRQLQHVLSLLVALEHHLQLPRHTLSMASRLALKHYETHLLDDQHVFSFGVETRSIAGLLDRLQPSLWKAVFVREVADQPIRSIYQLSDKPPFQHVVARASVGEEEEEAEEQTFYFTTVTENVLQL